MLGWQVRFVSLAFILVTLVPRVCLAQRRVQFVARGMQTGLPDTNGITHDFSAGHVFMIIETPTRTGIKEDAFGFYPRSGIGLIKGPGMLRAEFRCGPDDDCNPERVRSLALRFNEMKDSVSLPISDAEFRIIMQEVNKWDSYQYQLTTSSCIDFVDRVARDLGYPTPTRFKLQTPESYLGDLKSKVIAEQARRQAEAEEATRRAEEAKRQAEEEAERNRIPPGWVACNCPGQHALFGGTKWIRGVLYHPNNLACR